VKECSWIGDGGGIEGGVGWGVGEWLWDKRLTNSTSDYLTCELPGLFSHVGPMTVLFVLSNNTTHFNKRNGLHPSKRTSILNADPQKKNPVTKKDSR
jgi:hypothetical protein